MSRSKVGSVAGLALVTVLGACSDGGSGPSSSATQRISLMVGATPTAAGSVAASQSIQANGHEIVLDKVELVFSRIRLKRVEPSCGEPAASDDQGSGGDQQAEDEKNDEPRNDECEKFITGPLLVDLPLDGNVEKLVSVDVDTGTYRRAEFRIHKVTDDAEDAAFLADHPDLKGISVRVTGSYDGTPFVYTADVTAKQYTTLEPPLVVTAQGATDLTFSVDVSNWFVGSAGDLIDPNAASDGKPAANQVRENIIHSFHLFKDHDHDGKEDHDDH